MTPCRFGIVLGGDGPVLHPIGLRGVDADRLDRLGVGSASRGQRVVDGDRGLGPAVLHHDMADRTRADIPCPASAETAHRLEQRPGSRRHPVYPVTEAELRLSAYRGLDNKVAAELAALEQVPAHGPD